MKQETGYRTIKVMSAGQSAIYNFYSVW